MRRKLAAGNWKMNGTSASLSELGTLAGLLPEGAPQVVICPPALLLADALRRMQGTGISIGAQDCHSAASGAHTGDISAPMIADLGAAHVIIGHSERRRDHGEDDSTVRAKADAAHAAGLTAILCIGETQDQRADGQTLQIIAEQLAGSLPARISATDTVIAYEPVWAIGTGAVPTLAQIGEVHDFIRASLVRRYGSDIADAIPLLYGGSVKPDNAGAIFTVDNVDGALVGGASLQAADFAPIITALANS